MQVVSDCPTPEAGEYAAHALGSLSCDNFENASLMIAVDSELACVIFKFLVWVTKCTTCTQNLSFQSSGCLTVSNCCE